MIENINNLNAVNTHDLESVTIDKKNLSNKIAGLNAIACNNIDQDGFKLSEALKDSQSSLKALNATTPLEQILASQILALHELQQSSMSMALVSNNITQKQYFTNAAIKLANSCTAQIALLAKLQGISGQRIVVEHVEVHGQAIVGNVNRG